MFVRWFLVSRGTTPFPPTMRRRSHVIVGDDALGAPCGTMEFARTMWRLASPLPLRVIPTERTNASGGISTEARKPRARCEHAKLFLAKICFTCIGVQRFYLDPATASPCGLLARQSLASQTSTSLRCAQDDTDGKICMAQCRFRQQCGYSQQIVDAGGASPSPTGLCKHCG